MELVTPLLLCQIAAPLVQIYPVNRVEPYPEAPPVIVMGSLLFAVLKDSILQMAHVLRV
jgi:hypothetical protein